jgi:hypothetical protein
MRRFSIRTLMAFVFVSAVGLSAFRNASDLWAGTMLLLALAAVAVAVMGAVIMRGRERYGWAGFAFFGGGYLILSVSPLRPQLVTTHLLDYIHAKVVASRISTFEVSRVDQNSLLFKVVTSDGDVISRTVPDQGGKPFATVAATPRKVAESLRNSARAQQDLIISMEPVNRWRSAFPGAANYDAFQRVGQGLFALLAGLLGGMVAIWFYERRERGGTDAG